GQGPVAVAIAVNYRLHDQSLLPNVVFTAAIVSVVITDLAGGHLAQAVIRRQLERIATRWQKLAEKLELTRP
ncbi:MAG TPA: hypothetical protein VK864_10145, partial [Longimicrobiales bacterium]|nr:hypothetical protein [Longimicrobiales bacterium]